MISLGFTANCLPVYACSFKEGWRVPPPCSQEVIGLHPGSLSAQVQVDLPRLMLSSGGICRYSLLHDLQKGMATCVNLVPSLMAVENTHYRTHVQPQKAHEVTTALHCHQLGRACPLPPAGYKWYSGIFQVQDALYLKRKNKHLLLRQELKYCIHVVLFPLIFTRNCN